VGKLDGKVAFITGVARGQGRSHAVRLAAEGADIIGVDICAPIDTVHYPLAGDDDLDETVRMVEEVGGKMLARQADVRDRAELQSAFDEGVERFGRCDIVLANAGILSTSLDETDEVAAWTNAIDVMLTGAWHTLKVAIPTLVRQGDGGAIVLTGSTASFKGISDGSGGNDGYHAAKHGVLGLMRSYANLLAPHRIRVNSVHPTGCATLMITNEYFGRWVAANPEHATRLQNPFPVEAVEPDDISNAVLYLVSEDGRYVTGVALPVDAGFTNRV
jgi:SDR family mycofactocin-dependent oxidoreductase